MMRIIKLVGIILLFLAVSACSTLQSRQNKEMQVTEMNIQLGMAYLKHGKIRIAQRKLTYALQKNPKLPEAWYSMGYFLEKTGHRNEAQQYYLNAIALAPARGDVQNNYGTYLCRSGKYQESITHFLKATQDREYADAAGAYENAGLCALKIPDTKQAVDYFKLALQANPKRKVAHKQLHKLQRQR